MTGLTDLQRSVLDIITMHPKERPITGTDIANRLEMKTRANGYEGKDLRDVVHALRCKGYPICAHGRGYWYPKDGDELKAFIGSLEGRAEKVQDAIDGLKAGYSLVGQAKGQEEVKKATRVVYRANGVVYEVSGDHVADFLEKYPNAECL